MCRLVRKTRLHTHLKRLPFSSRTRVPACTAKSGLWMTTVLQGCTVGHMAWMTDCNSATVVRSSTLAKAHCGSCGSSVTKY